MKQVPYSGHTDIKHQHTMLSPGWQAPRICVPFYKYLGTNVQPSQKKSHHASNNAHCRISKHKMALTKATLLLITLLNMGIFFRNWVSFRWPKKSRFYRIWTFIIKVSSTMCNESTNTTSYSVTTYESQGSHTGNTISLQNIQTCSGAHTASYLLGSRGSFHRGKVASTHW